MVTSAPMAGNCPKGQFRWTLVWIAVVWSAWPESWVESAETETYALIGRAASLLR